MLLLMVLVMCGCTEVRPKAKVSVTPSERVFRGENVSLRCDIEEEGDWMYTWFEDSSVNPVSTERTYRFTLDESGGGTYICRGKKHRDSQRSVISNAVSLTALDLPRATITAEPDRLVFTGETVRLKCEIEGPYRDWSYHWLTYSSIFGTAESKKNTGSSSTLTIKDVSESDQDKYWCWGERAGRPMKSHESKDISLKVENKAQVVLSVSPQTWLIEGESVIFTCEVQGFSEGWTFSWYRDHQLLSDSSRGAGGSYTLSPAALEHTGVYVCSAQRGEPAYYTEKSFPQSLWVTDGDVILERSADPVTEGDLLILRCLHRFTNTSVLRADFYKDGSLLRTESTGEMTIKTVSKSDEGFYYCTHPERGQSPKIWISVRPFVSVSQSEAQTSVFRLISFLLAASPYVLASSILGVKCYRAKVYLCCTSAC